MSAGDVFLLVVRWLHLISAAAWVGGSLFYLLVLRPAMRRSPEPSGWLNEAAASDFRALVDTSILVLLTTGVILTLNRLTPGVVGAPYVVTLAVKIAMSVWMFALAKGRRRRTALLATHGRTTEAPTSRVRGPTASIPEPSTCFLLMLGALPLRSILRRRNA